MVRTTREQRKTLKRKWLDQKQSFPTLTYRDFRRSVEGLFGGSGCIMVPWCGMWVGIEPDGYAHT